MSRKTRPLKIADIQWKIQKQIEDYQQELDKNTKPETILYAQIETLNMLSKWITEKASKGVEK